MNRDETLGLSAYLASVALAVVLLFDAGAIFLGVVAPMVSGVPLSVYTVIRRSLGQPSGRDVAGLLKISAALVLGPVVWYLLYGCVFGCPGD